MAKTIDPTECLYESFFSETNDAATSAYLTFFTLWEAGKISLPMEDALEEILSKYSSGEIDPFDPGEIATAEVSQFLIPGASIRDVGKQIYTRSVEVHHPCAP